MDLAGGGAALGALLRRRGAPVSRVSIDRRVRLRQSARGQAARGGRASRISAPSTIICGLVPR
jgi:hypothetical protein